jgi:WD repeat-containing protein mio
VPTPRLYGYDFSYQGLLGIWEGFNPSSVPTPMQHFSESTPIPGQRSLLLDLPDDLFGSWSAALHLLAARRKDHSSWKPTVPTDKLVQRQIALQVCGWSVREEELSVSVKR